MRRFLGLSRLIFALAFTAVLAGQAAADHYDNLSAEEKPSKKKPPLTKYEKSEYISKSPETGKTYRYTPDGDHVDRGGKQKKGKHKGRKHDAEQPASSEPKPKKQFKKMSFDSEKHGGTQGYPEQPQGPSEKVLP